MISGVVYATTTQGWGCLIEKFEHAHMFVLAGYVLTAASFVLCGPMWPLSFAPSLTLVIISQLLFEASIGPQLVGSFTQGLAETIAAGYSDDIATFAALSSLYQSSYALGYVFLLISVLFTDLFPMESYNKQGCCRSFPRRIPHGSLGI